MTDTVDHLVLHLRVVCVCVRQQSSRWVSVKWFHFQLRERIEQKVVGGWTEGWMITAYEEEMGEII